jgi:hypothetical protein
MFLFYPSTGACNRVTQQPSSSTRFPGAPWTFNWRVERDAVMARGLGAEGGPVFWAGAVDLQGLLEDRDETEDRSEEQREVQREDL